MLQNLALLSAVALPLARAAILPVRDDLASCLTADSVSVLTPSSEGWATAVTPYVSRALPWFRS